jgi:dTDP-4-dehydrorhamnose reductase
VLEEEVHVEPLNHDRVDVTSKTHVVEVLGDVRPDAVVNTAALHHVEKCEEEPEKAFAVNAVGARNVAAACRERDAYLVHISTDYVFGGEKGQPYLETDTPRPLNTYGITKLAGEHYVAAVCPNALIMRVSGLYGGNPCRAKGLNFVDLMLKLADQRDEVRVVDNEVLTPTYTLDIARQIAVLLHERPSGLCHATAEGSCSWYAFAAEIFRLANCDVRLEVAGPDEFPVKVPRPSYSVLENGLLKRAGLNRMPSWQEGLACYIASVSSSGEPA